MSAAFGSLASEYSAAAYCLAVTPDDVDRAVTLSARGLQAAGGWNKATDSKGPMEDAVTRTREP